MNDFNADVDDLPEEVLARIEPELAPGEQLVWAGCPAPNACGKKLYPTTGILWVVGLATVTAICSLINPHPKSTDLLLAIGLISGFLCFVLGAIVLCVVLSMRSERRRLSRTAYALTDRRALIWRPKVGSLGTNVYTYTDVSIEKIHRTEFPDGSGDVVFNRESSSVGFFSVLNVRQVEALAREILINPDASQ